MVEALDGSLRELVRQCCGIQEARIEVNIRPENLEEAISTLVVYYELGWDCGYGCSEDNWLKVAHEKQSR
jgi:hypothetical protein